MEPRPAAFEVSKRDAPFVVGDVVRYVGTAPSHVGGYFWNQSEGIVLSCVYKDQWGKGRRPGYVVRVDWSNPNATPEGYHPTKKATYMASSLELVRPSPARHTEAGW